MDGSAIETQTKPRPRASKACSSCHARKVRCDVLTRGHPCTQCSESGFRCEVNERKKRRRKSAVIPIEGPIKQTASSRPLPEHMMLHRVPFYPFIRNLAPNGRANLSCKDTGRGIVLPMPNDDLKAPAEEDVEYLKQKGALELPDKVILDECVTSYFEIFHPFFPIVDRPAFLKQYNARNETSTATVQTPSLLLLHGIIFTACSFISTATIAKIGFTSRQNARSCFHRRARYLYEFDYETDDIVVIQTLLLMSHHYSSMIEQKHTWFWLYQAIGLAQGAGLHHKIQNASQSKTRLWKRIWWACIVRDRLVALGTGRPTHIRNADCSTAMIDMADVEEDGDTDEQRSIKVIFIDFAKLCWIMEDILAAAVSPVPSHHIDICASALSEWHSSLAPPPQQQSTCKMQILYNCVIRMIYNITFIALHQSGSSIREPSATVQMIAVESTALCTQLMDLDLERLCPSICVTAVLPPIIVHIFTIKSNPVSTTADNHSSHFRICMEFLERLGNIYWHAEFYHEFLRLTTGYALASARTSNKFQTPSRPQCKSRHPAPFDDNVMPYTPIAQRDNVSHANQPLLEAKGEGSAEQADISSVDGLLLEDASMLAHADQIFERWLEGDTNWLEEYTHFYSAFSST